MSNVCLACSAFFSRSRDVHRFRVLIRRQSRRIVTRHFFIEQTSCHQRRSRRLHPRCRRLMRNLPGAEGDLRRRPFSHHLHPHYHPPLLEPLLQLLPTVSYSVSSSSSWWSFFLSTCKTLATRQLNASCTVETCSISYSVARHTSKTSNTSNTSE